MPVVTKDKRSRIDARMHAAIARRAVQISDDLVDPRVRAAVIFTLARCDYSLLEELERAIKDAKGGAGE